MLHGADTKASEIKVKATSDNFTVFPVQWFNNDNTLLIMLACYGTNDHNLIC